MTSKDLKEFMKSKGYTHCNVLECPNKWDMVDIIFRRDTEIVRISVVDELKCPVQFDYEDPDWSWKEL